MKFCNWLSFALFSGICSVQAFGVCRQPSEASIAIMLGTRQPTYRFGLLDDMMDETTSAAVTNEQTTEISEYDRLFNELIFTTGDTKAAVSRHWEDITDEPSGFLEWLEGKLNDSDCEEECEALRFLLNAIQAESTLREASARQLASEKAEKEAERMR